MSFRASTTTYGSKSTSEIAAITGASVGDTVFNTDYGMTEWYTGATWVSNCSCTAVAASSISEGNTVYLTSAGRAGLMTNTAAIYQMGIGVCQYGGGTGSTISIRQHGLAKVTAAVTINIGEYAVASGTAGRATSTTSPSLACFGRIVRGAAAGSNAWVLLSFIERA